MTTDLSWIGVWLLVIGFVAIVVEGALGALWTVRLARHGQALSSRLSAEQALVESDLERLRAAVAETRTLWQPYERVFRFLRHPLVMALMRSLLRRVR